MRLIFLAGFVRSPGYMCAAARFTSSCFQLLIIVRMNPKLRRQLSQGLLPRNRRHRHPSLKFRVVLLPLHAHVSHRSALAYLAVQKSGAAAGRKRILFIREGKSHQFYIPQEELPR